MVLVWHISNLVWHISTKVIFSSHLLVSRRPIDGPCVTSLCDNVAKVELISRATIDASPVEMLWAVGCRRGDAVESIKVRRGAAYASEECCEREGCLTRVGRHVEPGACRAVWLRRRSNWFEILGTLCGMRVHTCKPPVSPPSLFLLFLVFHFPPTPEHVFFLILPSSINRSQQGQVLAYNESIFYDLTSYFHSFHFSGSRAS